MELTLNITVNSLATAAGVAVDDVYPEATKSRMLRMQLGVLQRLPSNEQTPIHYELAAKYLPALMDKYLANTGLINSSMIVLNVISHTPYFVRFSRTAVGKDLVIIQTKRTKEAILNNESATLTPVEIAESLQFLSTLFVLQGIADISQSDKDTLLPALKRWERQFTGQFAGEVSERCLAILSDNPVMRAMMRSMKTKLESSLMQCGGPSCRALNNGMDLMQCARCKVAVYCGTEHQKKAWPTHKALCFPSSF